MFSVDVTGVDSAGKRIDDMLAKIDDVRRNQLFTEMEEWQREDLNRQYPNTLYSVSGGTNTMTSTVETMVYPRSRRIRTGRRAGQNRRIVRQTTSTRPILRPELLQQLWQRMRALLGTIKWQ